MEKLPIGPQPKSSETDQDDNSVVLDDVSSAKNQPDEYTKGGFEQLVEDDYRQDIKLRKYFSWATFGFLCVWMIFVAFLLYGSSLSDNVNIALISGATVQVIGLYYIVLRYIFPS